MRPHLLASALLAILVILWPHEALPASPADAQAPDFELADLSGAVTRLSDHRGSVVVLNFWATWCKECVIELTSLETFADQYRGKGVTVLSVSVDRHQEALRTFLAEHPLPFSVLLDPHGDVFVTRYRTRALPATVLVDRQGAIAARLPGRQDFLSWSFRNRIEELLKGENDR